MSLNVILVPSRKDNYIFLLENGAGQCVVVDPGEYDPVRLALLKHDLKPTAIWLTHHHYDHIEGAKKLKDAFPDIEIYGFAGDAERLPLLDVMLNDGDMFEIFGAHVRMRHVPGHTLGHVFYHIPDAAIAFVGDTIFAMGCGRLFEGDPAMMYTSMQTINQMAADTALYCAHEYTLDNARFAMSLEPNNAQLAERFEAVKAARANGEITIPTTLALERATNPYLRCMSAEIRASLHLADHAGEIETFAAIRAAKDSWKG